MSVLLQFLLLVLLVNQVSAICKYHGTSGRIPANIERTASISAYRNDSGSVSDYYCACNINGLIDGMIFWDEIVPIDGPTLIYTMGPSNQTIGSQLVQRSATSTLDPDYWTPWMDDNQYSFYTISATDAQAASS